jgi:hypothetical protein
VWVGGAVGNLGDREVVGANRQRQLPRYAAIDSLMIACLISVSVFEGFVAWPQPTQSARITIEDRIANFTLGLFYKNRADRSAKRE